MKKVDDLFYFIMRGLADKTLSMDMPVLVECDAGFGHVHDWCGEFRAEDGVLKVISEDD